MNEKKELALSVDIDIQRQQQQQNVNSKKVDNHWTLLAHRRRCVYWVHRCQVTKLVLGINVRCTIAIVNSSVITIVRYSSNVYIGSSSIDFVICGKNRQYVGGFLYVCFFFVIVLVWCESECECAVYLKPQIKPTNRKSNQKRKNGCGTRSWRITFVKFLISIGCAIDSGHRIVGCAPFLARTTSYRQIGQSHSRSIDVAHIRECTLCDQQKSSW